MEALKARHAMDVTILESSLRQLAPKPRFGKAPSLESIQRAEQLGALKRDELVARHRSELETFVEPVQTVTTAAAVLVVPTTVAAAADSASDEEDEEEVDGSGGGGSAGRKGKAARRRERKDARLAANRATALSSVDSDAAIAAARACEDEADALRTQLGPLGFSIIPVIGDGHCLFRAVAAQLVLAGGVGSGAEFMPLRRRAADVIRTFWEEFAPFLPYDPSDGYGEDMNAARAAVGKYCDRVAASNCWGGHPEIRALAYALGCPILVFRARSVPIQFLPRGEEEQVISNVRGSGEARNVLRLSFHAFYSAGEHYNSVVAN
jgi:OTU domain-containing protein 6